MSELLNRCMGRRMRIKDLVHKQCGAEKDAGSNRRVNNRIQHTAKPESAATTLLNHWNHNRPEHTAQDQRGEGNEHNIAEFL